jgi:hypothetical protein
MLHRCPQCWKNFIKHIECTELSNMRLNSGASEYIEKYLMPYNAHHVRGDELPDNYVEFATDEDATAFILRYGYATR